MKTHAYSHKFDFGNDSVLIECKAYEWKNTNPIGSKIDNWKNAMFHFIMSDEKFKKFFVVERQVRGETSKLKDETLLQNFIRLKKTLHS